MGWIETFFAEARVGFSDKSASVRFTRFEYNVIYSKSFSTVYYLMPDEALSLR